MNTLPGPTFTEEIPLSIDVLPYGFHLLSWYESEDDFVLSFDFEWDIPPSQQEIEEYIHKHILWYALSRWFERITFWFGVPWNIVPVKEDDWWGEKLIHARWGSCALYFIENIDDFHLMSALLEGKDILIIYVWDIDISGAFLPFIHQVIDVMREEKDVVFRKRELKDWVSIKKMLIETPMTFAVRPGWIRWVMINASKIKGNISFKILDKMEESLGRKWPRWKISPSTQWTKWTQGNVKNRVNYTLRI